MRGGVKWKGSREEEGRILMKGGKFVRIYGKEVGIKGLWKEKG